MLCSSQFCPTILLSFSILAKLWLLRSHSAAVATLGQQQTHTPGNSVALGLVLHLLWTLGIHNNTNILCDICLCVHLMDSKSQCHHITCEIATLSLFKAALDDLKPKVWVQGKMQGAVLILGYSNKGSAACMCAPQYFPGLVRIFWDYGATHILS